MLKTTLLTCVVTLAGFAATEHRASAQCCHEQYEVYYYYAYQPSYYQPYYRVGPPRWSVGMHLTGLALNQKIGDETVALGGLGGHLRYRGYRLGGELSVDVLGNTFAEGGIERISVPIQASAMLYLIPRGVFNLYLLAGVRVVPTNIRWDLPNLHTDQTFTEFGMQGGVGAELLLSRFFALTADLRAFGQMRSDSGPDGKFYQGVSRPIVPEKSVGVQFSLGGSIRF